jgi:predicted HicB family RNase H-like nuclease
MTNINIEIPDDLHKKVKIKCAIDEISLKEFVLSAIEEKIKQK